MYLQKNCHDIIHFCFMSQPHFWGRHIVFVRSVRRNPCEHSRINIFQWILTKLGTYLVLKRIWNPIDFLGQRSRSPGQIFRQGDTPCFALPLFLLFLKIWFKHKLFFHQILLDNQLKKIPVQTVILSQIKCWFISTERMLNWH